MGSGLYGGDLNPLALFSTGVGRDGTSGVGGYWNRRFQWVNETTAGPTPFGDIVSSRFPMPGLPEAYQSAHGPVYAAYDRAGEGKWISVPIGMGQRQLYAAPDGMQAPSLAALQARSFGSAIVRGGADVPAALGNLALWPVDAVRGVFNPSAQPYSSITRGIADGSITWGSFATGVLESTPAGIITNFAYGSPESLESAGSALGGNVVGAGIGLGAGLTLRAAAKLPGKLAEYSLAWPEAPRTAGWAKGQGGGIAIPGIRNLRTEVLNVLPEGAELVRFTNKGAAIVRFEGDVFYSVPKNQYALIPDLRQMDTLGATFTQRVQEIADGFDVGRLLRGQRDRLAGHTVPWKYNRDLSAYRGSYVHDQFGRILPTIPGAEGLTYRTVGPDVVRTGGEFGLKYEITQQTATLNAIFSHTKKYPDELLRYVLYK